AAVPRLLDLGVEEFLLADVLRGVVGQRLVRRLCRSCVTASAPRALEMVGAGAPAQAQRTFEARGCVACGHTGVSGRVGMYEVVAMDEDLAAGIRARENELELTARARRRGFRDMREDGMLKVRDGETTLGEIMRVVGGE